MVWMSEKKCYCDAGIGHPMHHPTDKLIDKKKVLRTIDKEIRDLTSSGDITAKLSLRLVRNQVEAM